MKKLPKKFKKEWIAALKSGKFEQGMGELYNKEQNSYCCLGVACRVAGLKKSEINGVGTIEEQFRGMGVPKMLISLDNGKNGKLIDKLVTMNDDKGKSFKQIAKWIKKKL